MDASKIPGCLERSVDSAFWTRHSQEIWNQPKTDPSEEIHQNHHTFALFDPIKTGNSNDLGKLLQFLNLKCLRILCGGFPYGKTRLLEGILSHGRSTKLHIWIHISISLVAENHLHCFSPHPIWIPENSPQVSTPFQKIPPFPSSVHLFQLFEGADDLRWGHVKLQ